MTAGSAFEIERVRLIDQNVALEGSKLDAAAIESILMGLDDTNIEIESGRAQVRISLE